MLKNNLSKLMGEKRIKIFEIEKNFGISRTTLTRIYYNRASAINLKTLEALCKALDCTASDLFEYIPD